MWTISEYVLSKECHNTFNLGFKFYIMFSMLIPCCTFGQASISYTELFQMAQLITFITV